MQKQEEENGYSREIRFKVPLLPQSVNSLYKINMVQRVVYLSNEAKHFKYICKQYMPPSEFPRDCKFDIYMEFRGNWLYKNGRNKRADIQNLIKVLIDAIFERLGRDDSYLYQFSAKKIQSEEVCTIVYIRNI